MNVEPIKREILYIRIMQELKGKRLTAHEIADNLHKKNYITYPHRQMVAPRLTELERMERVEVVGKKFDEETKKTVSVYSIRNGWN